MSNDTQTRSRRRFLGACAGVGVVGMAGCTSDTGDGSNASNASTGAANGSSGSGGGGGADDAFVYAFGRSPADVQFNRYNVANWGRSIQDQFYIQVARGYTNGTIGSEFLKTLSVDGRTLTMEFPTGFTWWNGKELTAEDYHVGLEIDRLQDPDGSPVKENTLSGTQTIEMEFKRQLTPFLMKARVAETFVNTPRWVFQKYLDRLRKATSKKDRSAVTEDLTALKIPTRRLIDDGLGNGLFRLESFNASKSVMKRFEQHPYADRTSIGTVNLVPSIDTNLTSQISSNRLDMQPNTLITQANRSQYPDNDENVLEYDYYELEKFTFNMNNDHVGDRAVRRAIAHTVDFTPMVESMRQAGTAGSTVETQTGLDPSIEAKFLGEGWTDDLIDYPVESDTDGATELMEGAGYTKNGGNWADPDGNRVSLSILTPTETAQIQATKVFSDQLNDFGIGTDVNSRDLTDYYEYLQNYEADLYWIWHASTALWHPIAYFSNDFFGVLAGDPENDGKTGPTGVPFSLDIPATVGDETVSGNGRTVHPAELMTNLPTAETEADVQRMTRTLVQWFNYDLPGIVFVEEGAGTWLDTGSFAFDTNHRLNTDRPGQVAMQNGWITRN